MFSIRAATVADHEAVWEIMEPVLRAAETYALPRDMQRTEALAYWFSAPQEPFVAIAEQAVVGTYFMQPNYAGGGSHVANCGFMSHRSAQGRGVARAMLEHALDHARVRGFRAMQFNFVVSSNERAVKTWQAYGFEIAGRLPAAFQHPCLGEVDVLVMHRRL